MSNIAKHILVVDDDPDIRSMIKMILEYHGYTVTAVERAQEAEQELNTGKYAMAIMDMLLSGMNGTDICRKYKNDKSVKQVPIVMISAHPNAKTLCLNAGADYFVAKPFDMEHLLSVIDYMTNTGGAKAQVAG